MSYTITLLDASWKNTSTKNLWVISEEIINEWLLHEYVVMYLANQRQSWAHTKSRWEVVRSGRKLYRQKWTWRARVWDAGSPIRRSGWVAMWPRSERNRSKSMPKKMKRRALLSAIALQAKSGSVYWVEKLELQTPSTKTASSFVSAFHQSGKSLLIVTQWEADAIYKSFRNLNRVSVVPFSSLNAYEMKKYHTVLFVEGAVQALDQFVS